VLKFIADGADWILSGDGNLTLPDDGYVQTYNGNITLLAAGNRPWSFGADGNLTLPTTATIGGTGLGLDITAGTPVDPGSGTGGRLYLSAGFGGDFGGDVTIKGGDSPDGNAGFVYITGGVAASNYGQVVISAFDQSWHFRDAGTLGLPNDSYLKAASANLIVGSQGEVVLYSNATTDSGTHAWIFGTDSSTVFPNGAKINSSIAGQFATDNTVTTSLDLRDTSGRGYYTDTNGYTLRSNGSYSWTFGPNGELNLPVSATGKGLIQMTGDISLLATAKTFVFGADGSLTFPNVNTRSGVGVGQIFDGPSWRAGLNMVGAADQSPIRIYNPGTDGKGFGASAVYIQHDNVQIITNNQHPGGTGLTWQFDRIGTLTLPESGNIVTTSGNLNITSTSGWVNITSGPHTFVFDADSVGRFIMPTQGVIAGDDLGVRVFAGNLATEVGNVWTFAADGTLEFPAGYLMPNTIGSPGQVLTLGGQGSSYWGNVSLGPSWEYLKASGPQNIGNAADTAVLFDTVINSVGNVFIYTPDNAGFVNTDSLPHLYQLSATVTFDVNTVGNRFAYMAVNGDLTAAGRFAEMGVAANNGGDITCLNITGTTLLNPGDYFQVLAYQTSGGNLNISTGGGYNGSSLSITRLN